MTRIVALSDTHGNLKDIILPEGDILIHAGDMTMRGTLSNTVDFGNWLDGQKDKFKHVIVIAGNHDFLFQSNKGVAVSCLPKGTIYLEDSMVTVEGLKIYGSPYSKMFHNWAFMEEDNELVGRYKQIPEDIDVLITHGPAYGILDKTMEGVYAGSIALYSRIKELKNLKAHICGHIHESAGQETIEGVLFSNVAVLDRNYRLANRFTVIEV